MIDTTRHPHSHKPLIDDDNRQKISQLTRELSDLTGFSPAYARVLNDIIRQTDLEQLKNRYLTEIQQGTATHTNNNTST